MNRPMNSIGRVALLALNITLFTGVAFAHRMNVFAYVEGGQVKVEAYFGAKSKARHAEVKVYGPDGELLLTTRTDGQGECAFAPPKVAKLKIVVDSGDGHEAHYILGEDELRAASGAAAPPATTPAIAPQETRPETVEHAPRNTNATDARLLELQASINQLRREIHQLKTSITVKDVLAGIGFILGLTGIASFIMSRRGRTPPHAS